MKFFRKGGALALAGALAFFGAAARAAGPYLHGFDTEALLPPPPVVGDAEDKADRDSTFQVYSTRTDADIARAKAEHEFTVFEFTPEIGPRFTAEKFPHTAALFAEAITEVKSVVDPSKKQWNRPRPYVLEPVRFNHPADMEKSSGYPSGHATRATVMALLLVQIFPEHRDAILAKGRLIGWTRVEAGVHTPLDIYAGRVLGQALVRAFLASPDFQRDLAAARAEAAQVRER